MNKAALLIFLFFISLTHNLSAQKPIRCHSDERTEMLKEQYPEYYKSLQEPIVPVMNSTKSLMTVITIPVHVIIVHPPGQAIGTGVNFSMDHILSQIDVLNEDFRRTNGDASNTPNVFPADDTEIDFCMASVDPDGNPTDGVTRYGTTQNLNSNEFSIKSATGWDRNDYLNVWVGPGLGGILGWAYLPTTGSLPSATLDGVVVASGTFGGPGYGTTPNYDLGRTCTHEVGHYLGLHHVWRSGGCGIDDGIGDTPIQDDQNFGCPSHPSPSCGNGGDMFMNYMDYVNDDCMNAFTTGQGAHMQNILNTSRSSLLSSANTNCNLGGVPLVIEVVLVTDVLCFGENTGTVTVQASGGSGTFTYSIDSGPSQTSNIFTDLSAGPHVVTAEDGSGSSVDIDVIINEPSPLVPNIDVQVNTSCFGYDDGSLIVSAFGGTPSPGGIYNYSIDGGAFSPSNIFDNLSAGPHTVIVQDANGCETSIDGFIVEPEELLTLPDDLSNVTCLGENDGLISVITIGGNPLYTYSIDGISYQPEPIFFDLSPGDYLMTTLDINGCIEETPFSITEPDLLEVSVSQLEPLLCFDENTGSVTLEATGGTATYQYSIDGINYQAEPTFDNLAAGTYTLTVLDINDCTSQTDVVLDAPEELSLDLISQTEAGCAGQANGTITVSAIGGTGGNTFVYDTQTLTGDTVTFTDVPAGTHTVIVADDNACETEIEVEITESAAIELETTNVEDISCEDAMDGMIEVQGNGGSGNYFYSLNGGTYGPESIFMSLTPGDYTISVLDDAGCEGEVFVTLTAPNAITTEIESQTNPDCFGMANGTVDVLANGGTGTFEYILNSVSNTNGVFTDLPAGTYEIIAIDENDCSQNISVIIEQPDEVIVDELNIDPVDCFGNTTGSLSLVANGGNNVFEYTLGGTTNTTGTFDNLSSGTYTVVATDGNNCSQSITIDIAEPEALEANIDYVVDVNCAGEASGAIQVEVVGGSGTITYTLGGTSNDTGLFEGLEEGTYMVDVVDNNNCDTNISAVVASSDELEIAEDELSPVSCFGENDGAIQLLVSGGNGSFEFTIGGETNNTGLFENLLPGTYSAVVTDGAACSGTYDFEITEPEELVISIDEETNISCFGEANAMIVLLANGGTGTYTFDNGTTTNNDGIFDGLDAGTYEFILTDESACTSTIEMTIDQPAELDAMIMETQDAVCNGEENGSFIITASGGTGMLSYTSNSETNTTGEFNNLIAGTYPVTVVDANACETILDVEINQPAEIALEVVETSMNACFGNAEGTIQAAASGGAGGLEYTVDGITNTTGFFDNLPAGDYEIQVVDANACSNTLIQNISEPAALASEVSEIQQNNCFGNEEGTVQLTTSGGTGMIEYNLNGSTNNDGYFENLAAGDYEIVITDQNDCSTLQNISITAPEVLETEIIELQDIDCSGAELGVVEVQASGGSGNYEYTLGSESNSSGVFTDLPAGDYEIQIVDANACQTLQLFSIVEAADLAVAVEEIQGVDCFGAETGTVQVSANGGSGTYEFWMNGTMSTNGLFEGLMGGMYEISVVDQDGCTDVSQYIMEQPNAIESEVMELQNPLCFGGTGTVQFSAQGGNGDFEYTLNNETNATGEFGNLSAGNYELIVTDAIGCTALNNLIIEAPDVLTESVVENIAVDCYGNSTGFIQVEGQGGTGAFTYTLGSETNSSGGFLNLAAGVYQVMVSDENGCTVMTDIIVDQPDEIGMEIIELQNIDCGDVDGFGSVLVQATGGNGSFQYSLGLETNNSGTFDNLVAGDYDIQILDGNGCTSVQSFSIMEGANLNVEVALVEEIDCYDGNNGSIQISAGGGSGSFEFILDGVMNTTGLFENLSGGYHSIIVIDTEGCESETEYLINQPQEIVIDLVETIDPNCFGDANGALSVLADGGNGTYNFTLNSESNTSGTFENLVAGDYLLEITDGNGCMTSSSVTINEPAPIEPNLVENIALNCYGSNDGMIQVNGQGGSGNYTYSLGFQTNTTGAFENLEGGMYTVIVMDENSCSETMEVIVEQPSLLEAEVTDLQSIGCNGSVFGSAQINAAGGIGSLQYTLGSQTNATGIFVNLLAGDYSVIVVDENACSTEASFSIIETSDLEAEVLVNTSATCFGESDGMVELSVTNGNGIYTYTLGTETNTDGIFTGLPAGNYTVDITDGGSCNTVVNFMVDQPNALLAEAIEQQPLACFNDNNAVIQLEAFGGNGPYVYTVNSETNNSGGFGNLSAGNYEAMITDQSDCSIILEFVIIEPDAIQADIVENQEPACYGDSDGLFQIAANGGSAPYAYTLGAEMNTSGLFDELSAGVFQVVITDDNGCASTETITVSQPPVLISGALNVTPVQCNGGSDGIAFIGADGGTPGYQFELDGEVNSGGVFLNLPAGPHLVNVTDANGCQSDNTVVIPEPNELLLSILSLQNDNGTGNGEVLLEADGGTSPYLFSLDGLNYTPFFNFNNLPAGTYTGYVKDANNCITQITFVIEIEMETSISDPEQGVSAIQIYPNPFNNDLHLQVELLNAQTLEIRMYTIHGQELFFNTAEYGSGITTVDLDIPNKLPAGSYIVRINNENGQLGHYKLIKQK